MEKELHQYKINNECLGALEISEVFNRRGLLKCPNCKEHYTHLESIVPYSTDINRPCVELIFSCEYCSHNEGEDNGLRFSICVQQHEGITYLTNEPEY